MNVARIHSEGNPLYPLPHDYLSLTRDGARLARVNALKQWLLPSESKEVLAGDKIAALRFLDSYYLMPDESSNFDPGFYDATPLPTPYFHYLLMAYGAMYPQSLAIAPRGAAKTSVFRKECILELLTRPRWSHVYATSTGENAKSTAEAVRAQFSSNSRIFDDFTPESEFNGRIIPQRGVKTFGNSFFFINNGSWMRVVSSKSRLRGIRPFIFDLDDPEYDPSASTSTDLLRMYMDELIFKIALPAVMRANAGIRWRGTFVSRRHYLYHAWMTDALNNPIDPRFGDWARLFVPMCFDETDPSTKEVQRISCWPERWADNEEQKKKLNLSPQVPTIADVERRVGRAVFLSEYMGRPGESDDGFFPNLYSPEKMESFGYWYEGVDDLFSTEPWRSNTFICYHHNGELTRVPLVEFCRRSRLFLTVDSAYTENPDSDDKVATVLAYVPNTNLLFVLDGWASNKFKVPRLCNEAIGLAVKWRAPVIHVETVKESLVVYSTLQQMIQTRASELVVGKTPFLPGVVKFKPTSHRKEDRIVASLSYRFEHNLIKFPWLPDSKLPLRHSNACAIWGKLHTQVSEFNPNAENGGLAHDDCIDTVSMGGSIIRGKHLRPRQPDEKVSDAGDARQRMMDGEKVDHMGTPLHQYLGPNDYTPEFISTMMNRKEDTDVNRI